MQWPGNPIAREQQPILRKPSFIPYVQDSKGIVFYQRYQSRRPMSNVEHLDTLPQLIHSSPEIYFLFHKFEADDSHSMHSLCICAPASWGCRILMSEISGVLLNLLTFSRDRSTAAEEPEADEDDASTRK
jgi:hypothetical protein